MSHSSEDSGNNNAVEELIREKVSYTGESPISWIYRGLIFIAVIFVILLVKDGCNNNGKGKPLEQEVRVRIYEKLGGGIEKLQHEVTTPANIVFDYPFRIETDGIPIQVDFAGPPNVCYCANNKRQTVDDREKGTNRITRASKKCWKYCK